MGPAKTYQPIRQSYKEKINHKTAIEGTTGLWADRFRTWTKRKIKEGKNKKGYTRARKCL